MRTSHRPPRRSRCRRQAPARGTAKTRRRQPRRPKREPGTEPARPATAMATWQGPFDWQEKNQGCWTTPAVRPGLAPVLQPQNSSQSTQKRSIRQRTGRLSCPSGNLNCQPNCVGTVHAEPADRFADQVELKNISSLGRRRDADVEYQGSSWCGRATAL